MASNSATAALEAALGEGDIDGARRALTNGASVEAAGALHLAARLGHAHIVALLLQHCDGSVVDEYGRTALWCAAE
jgi:hypothetical protein